LYESVTANISCDFLPLLAASFSDEREELAIGSALCAFEDIDVSEIDCPLTTLEVKAIVETMFECFKWLDRDQHTGNFYPK
jgi:hypothetical protein